MGCTIFKIEPSVARLLPLLTIVRLPGLIRNNGVTGFTETYCLCVESRVTAGAKITVGVLSQTGGISRLILVATKCNAGGNLVEGR